MIRNGNCRIPRGNHKSWNADNSRRSKSEENPGLDPISREYLSSDEVFVKKNGEKEIKKNT